MGTISLQAANQAKQNTEFAQGRVISVADACIYCAEEFANFLPFYQWQHQ